MHVFKSSVPLEDTSRLSKAYSETVNTGVNTIMTLNYTNYTNETRCTQRNPPGP